MLEPAEPAESGQPGGFEPERWRARKSVRWLRLAGDEQRTEDQPTPAPEPCERCVRSGRTCPSCVQRRRSAWSLINEYGESVESAARIMKLTPERLRALVEEEADRRELQRFKCDSIPVALTRPVIEEALTRDPELTPADIARWLAMRQVDFERAFLGKANSRQTKARVNVTSASRLMIALGRAPNELPGC